MSDMIWVLSAIAICHHLRIQFRLADSKKLMAISPFVSTNCQGTQCGELISQRF
jgi:hypothetical protein